MNQTKPDTRLIDEAWRRINEMKEYFVSDDPDDVWLTVMDIIEDLGGRDPLTRKSEGGG
jgi:hypothetical protein